MKSLEITHGHWVEFNPWPWDKSSAIFHLYVDRRYLYQKYDENTTLSEIDDIFEILGLTCEISGFYPLFPTYFTFLGPELFVLIHT